MVRENTNHSGVVMNTVNNVIEVQLFAMFVRGATSYFFSFKMFPMYVFSNNKYI